MPTAGIERDSTALRSPMPAVELLMMSTDRRVPMPVTDAEVLAGRLEGAVVEVRLGQNAQAAAITIALTAMMEATTIGLISLRCTSLGCIVPRSFQ